MTRIVFAYPDAVWGQRASDPSSDESSARTGTPFVPDPVRMDDAIAWLAGQHGADVVALLLDFGEGRELEALRDRALAAGASRAHVLDVADQFASAFVLPALRAGALNLEGRAATPALARMAIAQTLVEIAGIEQTGAVAHGYPSADRSIMTAVKALDASLTVVPLPASVTQPSGDAYRDVARPVEGAANADSRQEPALVELTFARGTPTAINGVAMSLMDLIGTLDMLSRLRGTPYRGATAVPVLHDAHRALQEAAGRRDGPADRLRQGSGGQDPGPHIPDIAERYGQLLAEGAWFSAERRALDEAVDRIQRSVNGTVRLQLSSNECRIVDTMLETAGNTTNVTTPR